MQCCTRKFLDMKASELRQALANRIKEKRNFSSPESSDYTPAPSPEYNDTQQDVCETLSSVSISQEPPQVTEERPVLCEGNLYKLSSGDLTARWQRRFFQLDFKQLTYRSGQNKSYRVSSMASIESGEHPTQFAILFNNGQRLYLEAATEDQKTQWSDALHEAMADSLEQMVLATRKGLARDDDEHSESFMTSESSESIGVSESIHSIPDLHAMHLPHDHPELGSLPEDDGLQRKEDRNERLPGIPPHLAELVEELFHFKSHPAKASAILDSTVRVVQDLQRELKSADQSPGVIAGSYFRALQEQYSKWLSSRQDSTLNLGNPADLASLVEFIARTAREVPDEFRLITRIQAELLGELRGHILSKISSDYPVDVIREVTLAVIKAKTWRTEFTVAGEQISDACSGAIFAGLNSLARGLKVGISLARSNKKPIGILKGMLKRKKQEEDAPNLRETVENALMVAETCRDLSLDRSSVMLSTCLSAQVGLFESIAQYAAKSLVEYRFSSRKEISSVFAVLALKATGCRPMQALLNGAATDCGISDDDEGGSRQFQKKSDCLIASAAIPAVCKAYLKSLSIHGKEIKDAEKFPGFKVILLQDAEAFATSVLARAVIDGGQSFESRPFEVVEKWLGILESLAALNDVTDSAQLSTALKSLTPCLEKLIGPKETKSVLKSTIHILGVGRSKRKALMLELFAESGET